VLQLHERLSQRESALLVQLRTEKIGLNDFRFSRHVPDITSPGCSCGERRQTVAHVILRCSKYKDLRKRIFANLSGRHSLRTILSTPQLATKAIEYIKPSSIWSKRRSLGKWGSEIRRRRRALGGDFRYSGRDRRGKTSLRA
jgi:hypothetical protein